ncbi:ribonuclease P protein component [Maritimibacter sp. HL-12]|uniref:ribonuclease P protein component n=1 Tax=Maritimibacter sp. HL-12 TaxID=1162418 RepID=UPI000A1C9E15|nr:ribonuclease P protein component [Maritimibacter sp. HL-12]
MKPPEAPVTTDPPPAVSVCLETLKNRTDFLACAKARKAPMPAFLLQARKRDETAAIRVGFTASKKVGNAVTRNRAKRRLRALAREVLPVFAEPGWDYVLVARRDATTLLPFHEMRADLLRALAKLHGKRPAS